MSDITQPLRDLFARAGKWPDLNPVGSLGKYYDCPMCDGEGSIADDFVSEGTNTVGSGIDCSIVGVQVFGIGDPMAAMEKLVPLLMRNLIPILDALDAAQSYAAHKWPDGSANTTTVTFSMQLPELQDRLLESLAKARDAMARLRR